MSTPRQQGIIAEGRALVATAPNTNDPVLIQRAQDAYNHAVDYASSPVQWLKTDPQKELDQVGADIAKAVGVNPLDFDPGSVGAPPVNLAPTGLDNLSDSEKDILAGQGGNYGAGALDVAGDVGASVGKGIAATLKWLLIALVALSALYIYVARKSVY